MSDTTTETYSNARLAEMIAARNSARVKQIIDNIKVYILDKLENDDSFLESGLFKTEYAVNPSQVKELYRKLNETFPGTKIEIGKGYYTPRDDKTGPLRTPISIQIVWSAASSD